jgi:hypothetical protein
MLVYQSSPDFTKLRAYVERSTTELSDGRCVKDFEHYVFELALSAVLTPETLQDFYRLELD